MAKKKSKKKTTTSRAARRKTAKKVSAARKKMEKKVAKKTPAKKKVTMRRAKAKPVAPVQQQTPPPKAGSFVWHELMTTNVAACREFYARLFGWATRDEEMMPGFIYTIVSNKGEETAGMMAIAPEQGDVKPHWMTYVSVKDVDAVAQQAEATGGEIVVPPHDIPVGRWALLKDPTGATFAIYKSKSR